jgi:hypothetical protein
MRGNARVLNKTCWPKNCQVSLRKTTRTESCRL